MTSETCAISIPRPNTSVQIRTRLSPQKKVRTGVTHNKKILDFAVILQVKRNSQNLYFHLIPWPILKKGSQCPDETVGTPQQLQLITTTLRHKGQTHCSTSTKFSLCTKLSKTKGSRREIETFDYLRNGVYVILSKYLDLFLHHRSLTQWTECKLHGTI